jgi:3-deoxy-D-manno-octulosonic-acid transferase
LFFKPWGGWFRKILNEFSHIFVQNKGSHELLKSIGIKEVSVSGDTRYDRVHQEKDEMPFMNAFINDRKCIVAGSTWPQDIAVLKDTIAQTPNDWCWLIAPHEINAQAIETLMGELPRNSQRFTKCDAKYLPNTPVLVLDNVGLLSGCYPYAQIAYIGGGMGTKGLHNILEPAAAGIPIVIGKNYNRNPEAVELIQQGSIISISSKDEATKKLLLLMQDKVIRKEKGDINKHFVNTNIGATNKILDKIG